MEIVMTNQELLDYCNKYYSYNPNTGIFIRKIDRNKKYLKGSEAGYKKDGYRRINIKRKHYYAHRLAFLITYNALPEMIDHVNGIRDDNRLLNLREATNHQNCMNRPMATKNRSGYKGVSFHTQSKKWRARINLNKQEITLGSFTCPIEAAKAYNKAALELHGEFAFLNPIP